MKNWGVELGNPAYDRGSSRQSLSEHRSDGVNVELGGRHRHERVPVL
jgi:hypothetical protein